MMDSYHFLILTFLSIIGYTISLLLVKRGRLTLVIHRRIWNYLLLVSFLLSGLLGLLLVILIDYKLSLAWYREFLWLHVEFGIIMALISFFHIAWHWRYFYRKR